MDPKDAAELLCSLAHEGVLPSDRWVAFETSTTAEAGLDALRGIADWHNTVPNGQRRADIAAAILALRKEKYAAIEKKEEDEGDLVPA